MQSIIDIADAKGRLNYKQFKDFVATLSISELTDQAKYPFLVGKVLYDGTIMSRSDRISPTTTMRFNITDSRNLTADLATPTVKISRQGTADDSPKTSQEDGALSQAIFLVKRKLYSPQPENIVSIGRANSNDIVVADCVISKEHSRIILFNDMYFIVDLGSTNGTKVNHQDITPGSKIQLHFNDTVSFGRLVFVFTNPLSLYSNLRRQILG